MKYIIFFLIFLFKSSEALKCYKCAFFNKPSPDICMYTDQDTKVEDCKDDQPYCIAAGYNYHRDDGSHDFTNIRRCGGKSDKSYCQGIMYQYNEEDIRNCHVCTEDLCNDGPLVYSMEPQEQPDEPEKPPVGDGGSLKAEAGASADSKGNVQVSGSVSSS